MILLFYLHQLFSVSHLEKRYSNKGVYIKVPLLLEEKNYKMLLSYCLIHDTI